MQIISLEMLGYMASGIIALSMTMNTILRFRWVNLIGASSFSIYGILIDAYPVALLNGFIVLVDVYYLWRLYHTPNYFDSIEISENEPYLLRFLEFHHKDISKFFPNFSYKPEMNTLSFFILRNMSVAGLVLAHHRPNGEVRVGLDYVVPQYRDYKNGHFLYREILPELSSMGIHLITAEAHSQAHRRYLRKLGFTDTNESGIMGLML